jgi:aspartate/methionine/tyrosine aminotransferase
LRKGAHVRDQISRRISANYQVLLARAATTPSCRVLQADAGWYAVIQVPSITGEEDFVLQLLERDDVLVHPGYFFDFPRESFLVVSLLTPGDAFATGVSRLLRHFDCSAETA